MPRNTSHFQFNEPFLENILRFLRYKQAEKHIRNGDSVLDIGCGYEGYFLHKIKDKISKGVGYDAGVKKSVSKKITLKEGFIKKIIPENSGSFDCVTALAFIEHVENPEKLIKDAYRVLKPNGKLILTTPHKKFKSILELLSSLGLISKEEISDHKIYFINETLNILLKKSGFNKKNIITQNFEMGMNIITISTKV